MLTVHLANLLQHGRISPVEYYVCERFGVVYVENAKVACTAIKQALFPDVDYARTGQDRFHEALRARASRSPPTGAAARYLHFSFFRDPLARLESCYRDKIRQDAATMAPGILQMRFHRAMFAIFGGIDIRRPDLELREFVEGVARIPDRLRDRHIMSQAPVFQAVTQAPLHFVGRQENLARDWEALALRTGLPPLGTLNRSQAPKSALAVPSATLGRLKRAFAEDMRLLAPTEADR